MHDCKTATCRSHRAYVTLLNKADARKFDQGFGKLRIRSIRTITQEHYFVYRYSADTRLSGALTCLDQNDMRRSGA